MDRNSAIGLTLIAVLLLVYFNFFSPKPPPPPAKPANVTTTDLGKPDSATATPMRVPRDSDRVKQYGTLSSFLAGDEVLTRVETKDLIVTLSNQATLQQLELKNFKTYAQKPLLLTTANSSLFSLVAPYEGKDKFGAT